MASPFTINNHVALASEMMGMRLKLNRGNYDLLKRLCYEEWESCKNEVTRRVGGEINVGSSKQVQTFLYQELGLKPKFKRDKNGIRRLTADENALRELRVEAPKHGELLNAFIKERHIKKKIESYIEIRFDEDGYIPYSANPAGTETNRWSFSKSPRDRGLNAQTMPKVLRLMADAPPGRVFICPDLPQADARIVAWDAKCERLIELFNDPSKHFHLENCWRFAQQPGNPFSKLTKEQIYDPYFRSENPLYVTGKALGHAANYRMAAKRLAMELGCSITEATTLLDMYLHRLYPEIERWHFSIRDRIRRDGGLTTPGPFRRRRVFYAAWAGFMLYGKMSVTQWNEACAEIPQSAVADIVNVGMERLWLEKDYVRFHKHDHDSYLASVPVDRLGEASDSALRTLRVTLHIHDRPLEMIPEMQYGVNYGALVEWKGEAAPDMGKLEGAMGKKLVEKRMRNDLYGYY